MRLQMILGVTALALGVALTAVPASAAPATARRFQRDDDAQAPSNPREAAL